MSATRLVALEGLTPGVRVRGVIPERSVEVVQVEWHGTAAVTLTYKDDQGRPGHEILYREDEARLELEETERTWSFDADGKLFRLVSEARANVEVRLEIQADIPEGAPGDVVRTVTENARTLKFDSHGFERE